jgi:tRNA-2-methylthio-N6-dimethylallyladenosine synthase
MPYVDFVFGPDAIDELPEIVHRALAGERRAVHTTFDRSRTYSTETKVEAGKSQAFVNIMKGCDKFCTYCIVPFTRGREKSRTIDEVLNDLAGLVARKDGNGVSQGVQEITLLGQNVNSFGKGNPNLANREPRTLKNAIGPVGPRDGEENFPQLLRAIDADPRLAALKRIRFTSSHPLDFSDELLDCYQTPQNGGVARLAPHLHLPVQSGSNSVLQRMGRHHRIEDYIHQMKRLRTINPDVALTTDLIVGFPGETEADFEATLGLLDTLEYDSVYAFAYSVRPGTRAARFADDVPDEIKNARLNRLLAHQLAISKRRYEARVGKRFEVLIEGEAKNENALRNFKFAKRSSGAFTKVWRGRTPCDRVVNVLTGDAVPAGNLTGRFVDVNVIGATELALYSELHA